MIFTKTKLEGVYVLTPRVFTDTRGYFFESYSKREFEQNSLHYDFVQDNQSFEKQRAFQADDNTPPAQSRKLNRKRLRTRVRTFSYHTSLFSQWLKKKPSWKR